MAELLGLHSLTSLDSVDVDTPLGLGLGLFLGCLDDVAPLGGLLHVVDVVAPLELGSKCHQVE